MNIAITDFTVGLDLIRIAHKVFGALPLGVVRALQFDAHFDHEDGVLGYHGKAVAKLTGAPAIDEGDLLVV